jgi:hypothetical protein
MLFLGGNVNEIVRKTLHYYPIRYFFRHLFFDRRWPTFFFQITLYIFFYSSYKESSFEYSYIKRKNKKCKILIEKN